MLLNTTDKKVKIKMKFLTTDDFVNCYMPYSEIITLLPDRSNFVDCAFSFVKNDINMPWNEIIIAEMRCEDREAEELKEKLSQSNTYNGSGNGCGIPDVPGPMPKTSVKIDPTPTPITSISEEKPLFSKLTIT